jgi:vesicle coat complex subunit
MDGYYTRRKRDLDLSHLKQPLPNNDLDNTEYELEEDFEEIELEPEEDDEELEEGYEVEEIIDYNEPSEEVHRIINNRSIDGNDTGDKQMFIDGKPFVPKPMKKKQTFADTHVRITTYLEKNIHQIIRMLQSQGQIESITKFVNDSVKEYLMNNYHNEN